MAIWFWVPVTWVGFFSCGFLAGLFWKGSQIDADLDAAHEHALAQAATAFGTPLRMVRPGVELDHLDHGPIPRVGTYNEEDSCA